MDAIGGYQLLGRVSENRPVSVWKGRDSAGARDVAVKQVELTTNEAIARLRLQARVLTGISHPGIVEVLDLIEDQQHAWLVEAWVDGWPLAALLDQGELTAPQALGVISDALLGLEHAHLHGIVHGNITPGSLLVDRAGTVRLTNFGAVDPIRPVTPQTDLADVAATLCRLLPSPPPPIEMALDCRYADAGQFRSALDAATALAYGDQWRESADLSERVGAITEAAPVQVGVADRRRSAAPPAVVASDADVREFLDSRSAQSPSEATAGRVIPIIAAAVVVVAIVILALTHHDRGGASNPGLGFTGTYAVTSTLTTEGVGSDAGQPAGSTHTATWTVTPTCQNNTTCTAAVLPADGAPFTLFFANSTWTGERAMPLTTCAGSGGTGVALESFVLNASTSGSDKAGTKFAGSVAGIVGGCGPSMTQRSQLALVRTKS